MPIRPARRGTAALTLALAGGLILTGCGIGGGSGTATTSDGQTTSAATSAPVSQDRSAGALLKGMQTTANKAESVRINGSVPVNGTTMSIDIAGNRTGTNSTAKISLGPGQGIATLITVDGKTYIQGDKDFWDQNAGPGLFEQFGDKYIEMPAESAASMGEVSVGTVLDSMFKDQKFSAVDDWTTNVEEGTLDGTDVFILTDKSDDETRVYLSADGKDNLLKIEGTMDDGKGNQVPVDIRFSDWNAVPVATAPPADQVMQIPGT